ncbi:MAG: hypothetical protein IPG97_15840 [Microthrixaceae bacterium]|nr:hypothetical protein [Microthrixaceae bacterium]
MTITDTDATPDDILEHQAAAEGLTARPSRTRQDVPYDTDAEIGVLGVMLYSMTAAETVLGLGLKPRALYAPGIKRSTPPSVRPSPPASNPIRSPSHREATAA